MSCDRAGPALSTHRGDANDAERPDGVRWKPARGGGGGGLWAGWAGSWAALEGRVEKVRVGVGGTFSWGRAVCVGRYIIGLLCLVSSCWVMEMTNPLTHRFGALKP